MGRSEEGGVGKDSHLGIKMEGFRGLNSALASFHTRHENSRMLRTSWSIFRCLLFFDVCYLLSGIALMILAITDAETVAGNAADKFTMIISGAGFGIFATVSALCNSLACHGLSYWRKLFLVPWLTFYLLVLGLVTSLLLSALYSNNFLMQWRHVFLFFAVFTLFYCWSHIKRQFIMMALPRPDEVSRQDVESLVRDIMRQRPVGRSSFVTSSPEGDLPPKYEELGIDLPPEYDETTMAVNLNQETEEPAQSSETHPSLNCDSSEIHPNVDIVDNDDDNSDKNDDESSLKPPSNTEDSNSQNGIQGSIETKQSARR